MTYIYLKESIANRRGEVERLLGRLNGYYWARLHLNADAMREENPTKKMLLQLAHDTLLKDMNKLIVLLRDLLISFGDKDPIAYPGSNTEPTEDSVKLLKKYYHDAVAASGGAE